MPNGEAAMLDRSRTNAIHQIDYWHGLILRLCGKAQPVSSVAAMDMTELLGLDDLLAQFILAVGAAMVLGNGAAIWMHQTGRRPQKAQGEFRPARAWWLLGVGILIAAWGGASLLAG